MRAARYWIRSFSQQASEYLSWQRICQQGRRPRFNSWVRKIHWRRERLPTPIFLGFPDGSAGKESACNAGDLGSQSSGWEDPLEKRMATHLNILAWRIPWTEEPDRLQSMGLQRAGHTFT